ncbi:penicillin-binding protein [Lactobacillus farciminis KCTC 3681 = DSM] [Lactiplantibacillus mudanjiangensis]|uniref:serine hydrolase n=1 Tax=Lactiplantibacillus mudanjiangensis TaxID=1296538 RepID=UPI0010157F01|nr:penicillin-binding protein [Lactobacillus farciminis KCTC 3681 = DSM] [Lactiplantibacillus mudanjiangensis]
MKVKVWASIFLILLTIALCNVSFSFMDNINSSKSLNVSKSTDTIINTAKTTNYKGSPLGEDSLTKNTKKYFEKKLFSGSFEIVKNGETAVRAASGYANTNYYSSVNSLYNIGSLQFQINAAAILKLNQNGKIDLNQKVKSLLPNLKGLEDISIRDVVTNKNHLGIAQSFVQNKDYSQIVKQKNIKIKSYLSSTTKTQNNSILMALLIQKIENKNYFTVLEDQLLSEIPTLNYMFVTEIKQKSVKSVAKSYKYHVEDSNLQYDKPFSISKKIYIGSNQLYMSVSDLYNSMNYLIKSNYLSTDSKRIFIKGLLASNGIMEKKSYFITSSYNGFRAGLFVNSNGKNGAVMLLNVDPGKTKMKKGLRYLAKEYRVVE